MTTKKIQRLNHRAQGVCDDGTVYECVLPDEQIIVSDDGFKISEPSDDRVSASCSHFKSCGGCALQHASDAFVEDWKTDVIRQGLQAQGLEAELKPIITSPSKSRRRAKFSGRRTKKGAIVGFHARASDVVLEIPNCQLLRPELIEAIPVLQELTVLGASRKGEIALTVSTSETGLDVDVQNAKSLDRQLRMDLAGVVVKSSFARLVWNGEPVAMEQPPVQRFGDALVTVPAGAFMQATKEGKDTLVAAAQSIVGNAKQVIDLFAGSGTFSLPLAKAAEVHAVEGDPDMMDALDTGWRSSHGLKKVSTETRDLFRRPFYPDELKPYQAAVIDPPRAGALAQVQQLAQSHIGKIAFVSCNPVTFARDAKILVDGGYNLDWILPVDQFRWSSHVELIGSFTRN